MHFGRGHFGEHLCEIILIRTSVLGGHLKKKFTHDRRQITIAHIELKMLIPSQCNLCFTFPNAT